MSFGQTSPLQLKKNATNIVENKGIFIAENLIPRRAWWLLVLVSFCAGSVFLLFDPQPDPLLAISSVASFFIMGWGIYRLYSLNLLLSPMASVLIGPGWILYYTIGNLGPRIAGDGRFARNIGSLEYYPIVSLLATMGLALFMFIVFNYFGTQARPQIIHYRRLRWHTWQAIGVLSIAMLSLFYLSSRYEFVNGYFRNVSGIFDQSLAATPYLFISMGIIISVSVFVNNRGFLNRILAIVILLFLIVVTVGLRSRTSMLMTLTLASTCWITLRPRDTNIILGVSVAAIFTLLLIGSFVKAISVRGTTNSIFDNLAQVQGSNMMDFLTATEGTASLDWQYRFAGYEYSAALIASQSQGISPLYGEAMFAGILSSLPSFLRSAEQISERQTISNQYFGFHLRYGDTIGVILTSGVADWGLGFAPVIYGFGAIICIILWRFGQLNIRIYFAIIAVTQGPSDVVGLFGDLFWEGLGTSLKFIGFALIALVILGPLLLPYSLEESE
jgi:hypothetical protein